MKAVRLPAISVAAGIDIILVVVFVLIGRGNHGEAPTLAGTLTTVWPYLAGLAIGWAIMRAWRSPMRILWTGIGVWILTVLVGMLFRAASGQGTALSFVIVTTVVLGAFLLGWRAVAQLVARRRAVPA
jgi:hypothetical protein